MLAPQPPYSPVLPADFQPPDVNATVSVVSWSAASVAIAMATEPSRAVMLLFWIRPMPMEPEMSSAMQMRLPVLSTFWNAV